MRAFDCTEALHEAAHFTAESDELLLEKILGHFAAYHPEVTEDEVRELVGARTYQDDLAEEQVAESGRLRSIEPVTRPDSRSELS
jgi:hypothetical protein